MACDLPPAAPLSELIDQIAVGDLLLARPTSLRGWLLRLEERSSYCHAELITSVDPLIEATGALFSGIATRNLERLVEAHPGMWCWVPVDRRHYPGFRGAAAGCLAREMSGGAYGLRRLVHLGLRRTPLVRLAARILPRRPDTIGDDPVCSELVSRAAAIDGGIDPVPWLPNGYTTPGDLARSLLWDHQRARLLRPG